MTNPFFILLSLFSIIFVGALSHKYGLLPKEASKHFNKFIFYVSVPAVVFLSVATIDVAQTASFIPFILINIGVIFVGYILTYYILKLFKIPNKKKGVLLFAGNGGNVVYFGFPILLSIFGDEHFALGVLYATVIITVGDLMGFYLLGLYNNKGKMNIKQEITDFVKNPIVLATIFGTFVLLLGLKMPPFISEMLTTLSRTTTGLALFSLGIILYGELNFDNFRLNIMSAFLKLMILPTIVYVVVYHVFELTGALAETSVILAAMPTAVFSLIVADAYDLDKKLTSNTIVLSSLLFLLTFNFWVWVIG